MTNKPTEACQDELVGIRGQLFNLLLEAYGSTKPEHHPNVMQYRILNSLTVSSGGTCPECKGEGEIFHRGVIDTLKAWSRCTTCNGTGQEPIVTKTLGEIIGEYLSS